MIKSGVQSFPRPKYGAGGGIPPTSVALLHFDGTNGSTSFPDVYGHTWTATNSAQLSTTSPKFGTACLQLTRATFDSISTPDAPAFNFGSGDFTFELQAWLSTAASGGFNRGLIAKRTGASDFAPFVFIQNAAGAGTQIRFLSSVSGSAWAIDITGATSLTTGAWHHIAVVRHVTTVTIYIDGNSDATGTLSGTLMTNASNLSVGIDATNDTNSTFDGRFDELRLSNIAVYTANFTPPSAPFTS